MPCRRAEDKLLQRNLTVGVSEGRQKLKCNSTSQYSLKGEISKLGELVFKARLTQLLSFETQKCILLLNVFKMPLL